MRSARACSRRVGVRRHKRDGFAAGRPRPSRRNLQVECLEPRRMLAGIQAFHRSGQSFITWQEETAVSGETYHVYRHTEPITAANLDAATRLTQRWGPLAEGSSAYQSAREWPSPWDPQPIQRNFIIQDGGPQLADTTGLFVWTTHESGSFYYAVTTVRGGVEDRTLVAGQDATATALVESVAAPAPVRVHSTASGRGAVFTQFMDYAAWNPTFDGYAYNYSIALPPGYDGSQAVPLMIYMQGWGGRYAVHDGSPYDFNSIWVEVDDPRQTWHYGFNADTDYRTAESPPTTGTIVNFTELRILQAIDEVSRLYNVDANRIHGHGASMGGSGMLSLGLRYPNVFAAVYAGLPMTDYAAADGSSSSTDWRSDLEPKWGTIAANLPVENRGPHAQHLAEYNGTGVWDWMDHQSQVVQRRGDESAYLCLAHTMQDDVIDWESQGQPVAAAFFAADLGFQLADVPGGHSWPGFAGSNPVMIGGDAGGDWGQFQFRRDLSFPAVSQASHAPPIPPPTSSTASYYYNLDIEWSVPWHDFGPAITDELLEYGITLRSTSGDQTADLTPRRLQQFVVTPGARYEWTNTNVATSVVLQTGIATADAQGLLTIPGMQILEAGNRLAIRPQPGATLYVSPSGNDAAAGTVTEPLATVQHALNLAEPGTTILVRGGVYREWIEFPRSGTADAPITLAGYPGETAILEGTGLEWRYGVGLGPHDHLRLENLTIRDYIRDGLRGYAIGGSGGNDDIVLRDLEFSLVGEGIKLQASDSATSHGILIENVTGHDYESGGIDVGPVGSIDGLTIRQVTLSGPTGGNDTAMDGIAVEDGQHVTLEQVVVTGHHGDGVDLKADHVVLRRVSVTGTGRDGIKLWGTDVLVENSLAMNTGLTALAITENAQVTARNNLFGNGVTGGYGYTIAVGDEAGPSGVSFTAENNVFMCDNGNGGALMLLGEGTVFRGDYNLYYAPDRPATVVRYAGVREFSAQDMTDGDWAAAAGADAHALYGDPLLVDPLDGDFHLQSASPAVDYAPAGPAVDRDGASRPFGLAFDVGPYEWQGGTTYYVAVTGNDASAGTAAAPWRTLQHAADRVAPGDTVVIQPGTYAGGITHDTPGAAGRPITYRAAVAGQAVIDGSGGERDALFISESPWVIVDGLRVQNADRAAIRVSLSNHVTIRNSVAADNGTWGIFTDYSDDLVLENNECYGSQAEHGIYVSNSGDRPVIRNNRVHDNGASGIQINADPAMLWPELGTAGDGITDDALVENNVVWNNGRLGGAAINLASVRHSLFRNNLLYDNLAGGLAGWDDGNGDAWGTRDNTFVHNTVVFESGEGRTALNLQNGSTGNTVRNNILAGGRSVAIRFDASSLVGLVSDYNLLVSLDTPAGVAVNEDTGQVHSLDAWRTLTADDSHSVSAEPAFADRNGDDYRLSAASPARNAGDPALIVSPDLAGRVRPQEAAPDMGALEYAAPGPSIEFPNTSIGIHVFSDQVPDGLSDAMLQFIAGHYDGAQKMRTVFTDAVRAYNENFVMLHYRLAVGHGQHNLLIDDDWASDWSDVNPHEDWFLHAADDPDTRLRQVAWQWDLMDIDNEAWRAYWLRSTIDQMRSVKAQGVFADSWDVAAYNADVLAPWDARFAGTAPRDNGWTDSLGELAQAMVAGMSPEPEDFLYLPNLGALVTSWDDTDYSLADGGMVEGFGEWGAELQGEASDWNLQLNRVLDLAAQDKVLILQGTLRDAPDTPAGLQHRLFILGSYLLAKEDYTYVNILPPDGDLGAYYYPEYEVDLGAATTAWPADVEDLLWNGVYRRDFEHGLVLVNAGDSPRAVDLGGSFEMLVPSGGGAVSDEQIGADGSYQGGSMEWVAVTGVTLPVSSAAILRPAGTFTLAGDIFFLHQSTGQGIMEDHAGHPGLVSQLQALGHGFSDYDLWSWPPGGSVPTEIASLFADSNHDGQYGDSFQTVAALSGARDADVLMLKSCFYTLEELADPANLARWQQAFIDHVAPYANQHPSQTLVVLPAVPLRAEAGLSAAAAGRARDWAQWLAGDFITQYTTQGNVASFDLFDFWADAESHSTNANALQRQYVRSDGDNHPNDAASSAAADALAEFLAPLLPGVKATASGFVATFNAPVDVSALNLFDGAEQTLGAADVIVVGATRGPVRGSLVASADRRQITFVKSGGLLEPDAYTVTLFSGPTRFRDAAGRLLDGDSDGVAGDNFRTTLTVAQRSAGTVTVSLPDFARGAGQPVNIPSLAAGLPIRLDAAPGVTSLSLDLLYDPSLLSITAAALAQGVPGDWAVTLNTGTTGVARITAAGTTALAGTDLDVVRLTVRVPNDASYGASQTLRLENVLVNGGTRGALGDVAVHKAAYLGDTDGSGLHAAADAFLVVQTALELASGFAAHAWTDPRVVGDVDGSGILSAADAFLIVQEGLGLVEPFVPDNPHIGVTPASGGVDPQFRIDAAIPAPAGGWVTVPVRLAIEPAATNVGGIDFDLFFDPGALTIDVPSGVSLGADTAAGWGVSATLVAAGQLRVGLVGAGGQPLAPGLREIARLRFYVADQVAASGPDAILLAERAVRGRLDIEPVDSRAGGYTWTAVDGSLAVISRRHALWPDLRPQLHRRHHEQAPQGQRGDDRAEPLLRPAECLPHRGQPCQQGIPDDREWPQLFQPHRRMGNARLCHGRDGNEQHDTGKLLAGWLEVRQCFGQCHSGMGGAALGGRA